MVVELLNLDRGDKKDMHIGLYEAEVAILDELSRRNNCSRAAVIGELLRQVSLPPTTGAPGSDRYSNRPRRPGAGRKSEDQAGRRPGGGRPRAVTE